MRQLVDADSQDDDIGYIGCYILVTMVILVIMVILASILVVRMMILVIPPCLPVSRTNTSYCDFFLHHTINTSQSYNKTQHYITLLHITKKNT